MQDNTPPALTEEQLQQIRKRAEKATPGPWVHRFREIGLSVETWDGNTRVALYQLRDGVGDVDANGRFIAHSREDMPALLAEVERLRAENAAMREVVQTVAKSENMEHRAPDPANYGHSRWICVFRCDGVFTDAEWKHSPDCPVTKARAILAAESEGDVNG